MDCLILSVSSSFPSLQAFDRFSWMFKEKYVDFLSIDVRWKDVGVFLPGLSLSLSHWMCLQSVSTDKIENVFLCSLDHLTNVPVTRTNNGCMRSKSPSRRFSLSLCAENNQSWFSVNDHGIDDEVNRIVLPICHGLTPKHVEPWKSLGQTEPVLPASAFLHLARPDTLISFDGISIVEIEKKKNLQCTHVESKKKKSRSFVFCLFDQ